MESHEIPGTGQVLCVLTSHNGPCRGAIGIVDPALGANAQQAIHNLTPEVDMGLVNQGDGNHIRARTKARFLSMASISSCPVAVRCWPATMTAPGRSRSCGARIR